jgi:long-chain fatty acid transport protein
MAGAAGYQIQEQSVKGLGNAFAGGGAIAEDASTALYKPAGLTRLNSSQAEFGVHIIFPQADFKNAGSTNGIGAPAVGGEEDGGEPAVVPNLFYAQPVNDNLTFGFAVSSLYGLVTEYDRNWIGRYHAVKSDLLTLTINPSIGYRINQQLSFGVGVSAQYADAKLTNALDFGTLGFLAGAPVTPSTPAFDGFTKVEGDDWGFGFNAGMLYELDENTRIGLSFRSKVEHTLKGDNRLTIPDFAVALAGPSRTRGVQTSVTIPATLSLSGYHQIDQHWAVMADVTWTDWSVFDELRLEFDDGSADAVQPEEWDDAYRFSLGASYRYNDAWTLRAGVAYDQSPVPGADRRTPRIPDDSRTWVTVGASYRLSEAFSFDVAYAHIFIGEVPIRDTEVTTGALANGAPVGSTLDGEFDASVDILSAQIQWKF